VVPCLLLVCLFINNVLGLSKVHSCPHCTKKYIRDGAGRAIALFCFARLLWDRENVALDGGGDDVGVCDKEGGSSVDDGEGKGKKDPNEKQDVGGPRQSTSAHVTTLGQGGIIGKSQRAN
jgi:hypothetical protein